MSRPWRQTDFADRVGTELTLRPADGPAAGQELIATVAACTDVVRSGDIETYTVTIVARAPAPQTQGAFELIGAGAHSEPIFLVPHRATADTVEYAAVFNQFVQSGSES